MDGWMDGWMDRKSLPWSKDWTGWEQNSSLAKPCHSPYLSSTSGLPDVLRNNATKNCWQAAVSICSALFLDSDRSTSFRVRIAVTTLLEARLIIYCTASFQQKQYDAIWQSRKAASLSRCLRKKIHSGKVLICHPLHPQSDTQPTESRANKLGPKRLGTDF